MREKNEKMIAANELRIGNWANNGFKDYQVSGATIWQLGLEYATALPIPLTEEWLLRFGFKKHKCGISGSDEWQGMEGEESKKTNIYHKESEIYPSRLERFKIIPFNSNALTTLEMMEEKLRAASEFLFNFINQDEEQNNILNCSIFVG